MPISGKSFWVSSLLPLFVTPFYLVGCFITHGVTHAILSSNLSLTFGKQCKDLLGTALEGNELISGQQMAHSLKYRSPLSQMANIG